MPAVMPSGVEHCLSCKRRVLRTSTERGVYLEPPLSEALIPQTEGNTMEAAFSIFMSWQAVFTCLVVAGLTYVLRTAAEGAAPGLASASWWTKAAVPLAPLCNGALLGVVPGYPWPEQVSTLAARIFFGFVCGMFSMIVYARARDFMKGQQGG